jgi:hypothetical protein
MNNFGKIKTKILKKLTESYSSQNKSEMKDILKTIKENKEFKEMYLFYEEIENKYFEDKETAKLYVEGLSTMLTNSLSKGSSDSLGVFCESLDKKFDGAETQTNEIYESLDTLTEKDSLSNIEKKVIAKKKLVEHLTTKKELMESDKSVYSANENLLHAVLANNFNVLYTNNLNETQKEELKNILSISNEDLVSKTNELKESILNKVGTLLSESNDNDLYTKLNKVKSEVQEMDLSKYNYYKLTQLKNGLD